MSVQSVKYIFAWCRIPNKLVVVRFWGPNATMLVSSVRCVAIYVHLIIVKIYNQIEDTVLIICLLNRAKKVPQDINTVQKMYYNEGN